MGIKPQGQTGVQIPPDNPQTRWEAWEADLKDKGEIAGKVFAETHAIATSQQSVIDKLLKDSKAIGNEQKTISDQMRELLDPDNPNSSLWTLQTQINELQRQRNDNMDQMIDMVRNALRERTTGVWRTLIAGRGENREDSFFRIEAWPRDNNARRVTATGKWTGEFVYQSVWGGDAKPTMEARKLTPTSSRVEKFLAYNQHPAIVTYRVDSGEMQNIDKEVKTINPPSGWSTIDEFSFTPNITGEYLILFRVGWNSATSRDQYGLRAVGSGDRVIDQVNPRYQLGPLFPWQDGYRTQELYQAAVLLKAGENVRFQVFTDSGSESSRMIREAKLKLSWIIPNEI